MSLGWRAEQVEVVDDDQNQSGASASGRGGIQRLVSEVALGQVGAVLGLEVSRLARSCVDWYRLLEVAALAQTLIVDEDGVYDPNHYNDRLLLGLKGTLSEAELHFPGLRTSVAYERALAIAREILGADLAFDFDMLIDKAPHTATPTPWHQDCAYWIDLPDRRAASCWIALDDATLENGCMWFVPGSHELPMRPHRPAGPGGALACDASESDGVAAPLAAGACTFHAGATLHYSRGNSTGTRRRALIINFRPQAMVEYERARGFDHGKDGPGRENRNPLTR